MADICNYQTRTSTVFRPASTHIPKVDFGQGILGLLKLWYFRHQSRRELAELSVDRLKDLGIERSAVWEETNKPFWR